MAQNSFVYAFLTTSCFCVINAEKQNRNKNKATIYINRKLNANFNKKLVYAK